jgi:hypothetical protein
MNTKYKIDRLGTVQAAIAKLQEEEKVLKEYMVLHIKAGTREEGDIFGVSHSEAERKTVAYKTIAERLGATRQMIVANTKKSEVHTIKVTARQT